MRRWRTCRPAGWFGGAAVFLALYTATVLGDRQWAAVTIMLVAATTVSAALLRRGQGWLFAGNLLAMLAVTLVVWDEHKNQPLEQWFILLVQINLATAAVVGSVWLAGREWVTVDPPDHPANHGWLLGQQMLTFLGNAVLLAPGMLMILLLPSHEWPAEFDQLGRWPGRKASGSQAARSPESLFLPQCPHGQIPGPEKSCGDPRYRRRG